MPATDIALTSRQRLVLEGLQRGDTPQEIAKRLKITPNGVYQHRHRLEAKGALTKRRKTKVRTSNGRLRKPSKSSVKAGLDARTSLEEKAAKTLVEETKGELSARDKRYEESLLVRAQEQEAIEKQIASLTQTRDELRDQCVSLVGARQVVTEALEKLEEVSEVA